MQVCSMNCLVPGVIGVKGSDLERLRRFSSTVEDLCFQYVEFRGRSANADIGTWMIFSCTRACRYTLALEEAQLVIHIGRVQAMGIDRCQWRGLFGVGLVCQRPYVAGLVRVRPLLRSQYADKACV